jgi:hypothetical protein
MIACIVGAILCSQSAAIQIDGPLAYARSQPGVAWNYAAYYAVPTYQFPSVFPITLVRGHS